MSSNKLTNKALKSGYSFVGSSLFVSALGVIAVPIYLIYLSPAQYGVFSLFLSTATLLVPFLSLSGDAILARLYFFDKAGPLDRSTLMGSLIASTFINCILVSIVAFYAFDYIASFFFNESANILDYKFLIFFSANAIVFIKLYERLLKSSQNVLINPILKITRSLIQISLSLLFLTYLDLNAESLIFGFSIAALFIGTISIYGFYKKYKPNINSAAFKLIYLYTLPLIPNRVAAFIVSPAMNYMIFSFLSLTQVGIYNIAYLVVNILLMVFQKIHEAFQPWLYQALFIPSPDHKRIKNSIKLLFISYISLTILAMLIGPGVLEALFPSYFAGQSSFIRILMLFPLVNASKSLAVSLLMKKESGGYYISFGTYFFIILLIITGFFLIPSYNLTGAAITLVLSRYISSELTIYFALRDKDIFLISYFKNVRFFIVSIFLINISGLFVEYFLDLNEIILVNALLLLLLIFIFISYKKDIKNLIKILLLRSS